MQPLLNTLLSQLRFLALDLPAPDVLTCVGELESRAAEPLSGGEQAQILQEVRWLIDALQERM